MRYTSRLAPAFVIACFFATACAPIEEESPPELRETSTSTEAPLLTCAPRSAAGYTLGHRSAITVVDTDGKPVEISTANAYNAMSTAAAADGVYLRVVSGFRSYEEQSYLYSCYDNCNCNNCNLAAFPGYSNHQSGLALDLNTHEAGVSSWLNRNGPRFGFERTVPEEPWHWEYFGPRLDRPCSVSGGSASSLAWVSPRSDGAYLNGIWFKVQTQEPAAHHVRYFAGPYLIGSSEDRERSFEARYTFHQTGTRDVRAVAYDADDQIVSEASTRIRVTLGDFPGPAMQWTDLVDGGWYENNLWLKVSANAEIAEVRYYAGSWLLGSSTNAAQDFAFRYEFSNPGFRSIRAEGIDQQGRVRNMIYQTIRVTE